MALILSGSALMATATDYESMEWREVGEGSYKDPILSGMYVGFETEPVTVNVEEAVSNPGIYRLSGQWQGSFSFDLPAKLIIDISDPEMGVIPVTDTGLKDSLDGETYIASVSMLYTQRAGAPMTKEEFLQAFDYKNIYLEGKKVVMPANCVYFNWPDTDGSSGTNKNVWYPSTVAYSGYFMLPDSSGVEAGQAEEITSEYFTLQGMRVSAPERGQLLLRRTGSKTEKVVF